MANASKTPVEDLIRTKVGTLRDIDEHCSH